ncbi:hypothetical protein ABK040_001724 [Willaertia magna]
MNKKFLIVLALALIAFLVFAMEEVDANGIGKKIGNSAAALDHGKRRKKHNRYPYKKYRKYKKYYDNDREVDSALGRGRKWHLKKHKKYNYDDKDVTATLGRGYDDDEYKYKRKGKYHKKKYHKYPRKHRKHHY